MSGVREGSVSRLVRAAGQAPVVLMVCSALLWTLPSGGAASEPAAQPGRAAVRASPPAAAPVFRIIEGAKGAATPYSPAVLVIPVGKKVRLEITDHIGGCALVTVFPGLAVGGGTVRARVPVGQTRAVLIQALKPGHYRYHCSESMFFGEIVAR